jgi:hypothetical protein
MSSEFELEYPHKGDGLASSMIQFRVHPLNSDELRKKTLGGLAPNLRPMSQVLEVVNAGELDRNRIPGLWPNPHIGFASKPALEVHT